MYLAAQHFTMQIVAEKNCLAHFAQFGQGLVGRVLQTVAGKAAQDRLRFGRAQAQAVAYLIISSYCCRIRSH